MEYGFFKFTILFEDGKTENGWTPYAGDELSTEALRAFVTKYYAASKPVDGIQIYDFLKINSKEVWFAYTSDKPEYHYLCAQGLRIDKN